MRRTGAPALAGALALEVGAGAQSQVRTRR
jgi:hypothetical protein